jgi:hypothetical protein
LEDLAACVVTDGSRATGLMRVGQVDSSISFVCLFIRTWVSGLEVEVMPPAKRCHKLYYYFW